MFYCVFVFLLCFFIFSGTTVSTTSKGFYISGYDTSNAEELNENTVRYRYKKNEVLHLSCHIKQKKPVICLRWLLNKQTKLSIEEKSYESKLLLNITKSNDGDVLTCYAFEADPRLKENEKRMKKKTFLILSYIGHEDTTTSAPKLLEDMKGSGVTDSGDNLLEKLLKSPLFWIGIMVAIVVIILATILVFASKRTYRIKEYKVGLHPAVSNASVFTTDSRTPIIPQHCITEDKVGIQQAVDNASYFTTNSRTRIIPRNKITEVNFYTNGTYNTNKTQLHASHEIINSEYQEPIDSQAYCEPQVYSEPDKQFYAEPIPKILRKKNDTAYVNYNKSNGSANINNENIDLYQNCENIHDNEFYVYTKTS